MIPDGSLALPVDISSFSGILVPGFLKEFGQDSLCYQFN